MKEQDIIDLGFERVDITKEQSGHEDDWHYYTYDFTSGFSLITQANDEVVDDKWVVEVFETSTIRFTDKKTIETLIKIITKAKINE